MKPVKFSTACTWVAFVFLLQLLVTQWTVEVAGNREVIDYVSFAGTVVGMILAMLAIVYSFLITSAQRNDAENLRGQLHQLNEAVLKASLSGARFESEVEKLEEIRSELQRVSDNSVESLKGAERLEAKIDTLAKRDAEAKVALKPVGPASEPGKYGDALQRIATMALPPQIVQYYAVLDKVEGSMPQRIIDWTRPMLNHDEALFSFWEDYVAGECSAYRLILSDLNAFDEPNRAIFLDALRSQVDDAVTKVTSPDYKVPVSFSRHGLIAQLIKVQEALNPKRV